MVTAKTQYNLKNAQEYFEEHLAVGDYYAEGQRVSGLWTGRGAEWLSLSGTVLAKDFLRLCENQHPVTGERLTPEMKTTRIQNGRTVADRRIFYDFTFSPPKSVSLAAFLGEDKRIFASHARAVQVALEHFEAFAATRVRIGGARSERLTGSFAAALFTHETSRALDPHLHTHSIVFNATFDPVENRWKALENYELLRARKFAENVYYHELARDLKSFGYQFQNRARGDFQIEGISQELYDRFSKRHGEIDAALDRLLSEKPELKAGNLKDLRARLAESDRLHLKANRKLASGGRVTNGELVAVKEVCSDGAIELTDGRVLDSSFRELLAGYAVTSYGSQGKTVDYVLFSDSTIKAATNAQQWYVTISRGRRGIRIFTPDKDQLRENVARSGHKPLALELAGSLARLRGVRLWDRLHSYMLRFGRRAADHFCRLQLSHRRHPRIKQTHEHKTTRMLGERSERSRGQNRTVG